MSLESIAGALAAQAAGEASAVGLLEQALSAVARVDSHLKSVVVIDEERARAAAQAADRSRQAGETLGPLHGVPVAVKDIIDMAGLATRCGSPAYPDVPVAAVDPAEIVRADTLDGTGQLPGVARGEAQNTLGSRGHRTTSLDIIEGPEASRLDKNGP